MELIQWTLPSPVTVPFVSLFAPCRKSTVLAPAAASFVIVTGGRINPAADGANASPPSDDAGPSASRSGFLGTRGVESKEADLSKLLVITSPYFHCRITRE